MRFANDPKLASEIDPCQDNNEINYNGAQGNLKMTDANLDAGGPYVNDTTDFFNPAPVHPMRTTDDMYRKDWI